MCSSKEQLEQRVKLLEQERDQLTVKLDDSTDRVLDLEQENKRQKAQVRIVVTLSSIQSRNGQKAQVIL